MVQEVTMYQKRISTSESPRVEVTACQGDLVVATWDKAEVLIEVDSEEVLSVAEREGAVSLTVNSDGNLTVPAGASLVVAQAQGDLSVQGLRGPIEASTIQGDAKVRQVNGAVDVNAVGGDLSAEEINGPLSVRSVAGDAYLRRLNGPLSLGDVGADLIGRAWAAGADVAQVGGDVSLKTVFAGPLTYSLQARGNIVVRALPSSKATFTLQAAKGRVKAKGLTEEKTGEGRWQAVMGDGEAQVTLTSTHGNVLLKTGGDKDEDQEHAAFPFAADVGKLGAEAGLAVQELACRIQQRVAEKLARIDVEAIARREAERARRQAEREAARAQRKAERARRKKEQKKARWRFEWAAGHGGRRRAGRSQATSEEERLAVLRMLAEGQISVPEAETLLQALEG
jgi:DUF4097 and DUF4098 domain-containing protein YvlB